VWLLGAALGFGFGLVLTFNCQQRSAGYALSVEQALALQPSADVERVRGILRPESLCKRLGQCGFRWYLENGNQAAAQARQTLEVLYDGCEIVEFMQLDLPPGFDVEVTVEGTRVTGARLVASKVLAKSPRIAPGDPIWDSRRPPRDCQ